MHNLISQLDYLQAKQASAWIELLRDSGPQQHAEFVAWLKQSPRNVREILQLLAVDRALKDLDADRRQDIESLLAQVNRQVVGFPTRAGPDTALPAKAHPWRWAALAASLAAILLTGWIVLTRFDAGWKQYQTAKSEQRAFELEDGTLIDLNTYSRVAVHFSQQRREVRLLEGEAFFRVRHDPKRPFFVYTSDAVIQDVGTEFNVYNRADGTVIAVIEGRVTVAPEGRGASLASSASTDAIRTSKESNMPSSPMTHTLSANEEARVDPAGAVSVRILADASDAVAWQRRRLVFRQQTLQRIVEEFNRYSHQKIRLEGAVVMNHVFTGVFDADDPESLVQVLAREADLAVEKSDEDFIVRSR